MSSSKWVAVVVPRYLEWANKDRISMDQLAKSSLAEDLS